MLEANSTLSPGPDCINLLKLFEGCKLHAYQDSVGVATIGYGHTKGVHKGDTCTQQQAEDWLYEDADEAWQGVYALVAVPLTQGQCDGLTSFVFNLGVGKLKSSTLLKKLNAGEDAAAEFDKWVYAGGKVLPGLVSRRTAEKQLFLT